MAFQIPKDGRLILLLKSSGCLLLANALALERQEQLSGLLIERAIAVVGEGQSDDPEAPHPTRRVLMQKATEVRF